MADEENAGILKSIGKALGTDLRDLTDEPPPKSILLRLVPLIRRKQELCGEKRIPATSFPLAFDFCLSNFDRSALRRTTPAAWSPRKVR